MKADCKFREAQPHITPALCDFPLGERSSEEGIYLMGISKGSQNRNIAKVLVGWWKYSF